MSGHTPGPWHVRTFDSSQWSVDAAGDLTVAQAMQIRPMSFDRVQEERTANARLIAAAPTMYDFISARAANGDAEAQAIVAGVSNAGR